MSWQTEMVDRLKRAKNGEKREIMTEYMTLTGKSENTLYKIAHEHGYEPRRKKRSDAGKTVLTDEQIDTIFAMLHQSGRDKKGAIMPVEKALINAERNGIIEPGTVSASRLQAILRERSKNAKALKKRDFHTPMQSLYPNHVHEVDASVCIQYYLKPGDPLEIMDKDKFYKNKYENFAKVKRKIIRWVLTDHYSGSIFVKYYQSDGERMMDLYDFLCCAWGFKDPRLPFRGVPEILLMDAGAANKSRAIVNWLNLLGVNVPAGEPGHPTKDGQVENSQQLTERWFESDLRFEPATSVEELNAWALDWCIWFNGKRVHTRHRRTRTTCWLSIPQEKLNELPEREVLNQLFATPSQERTVNVNCAISYDSQKYSLRHVPDLAPGDKVKVVVRPYSLPEIGVIHRDVEYAATPIETNAAGFDVNAPVIGQEYKSLPETPTQKAIKRSDQLAFGGERKKRDVPFAGRISTMGKQAQDITVDYLPRRGTPHILTRADLVVREIPVTRVLKRLGDELGGVSPSLNRQIRDAYGSSLPEPEAERIIEEIVATGTFTAAELAAAGGGAC